MMKHALLALSLCLAGHASAQEKPGAPKEPEKPGVPVVEETKGPRGDLKFQPVQAKADWAAVRQAAEKGEVGSRDQFLKEAGRKGALAESLPKYISQAAAIDTPVLMPLAIANARQTQFVTRSTHYSLTAELPGDEFVSVSGTCAGVRLPEGHPILKRMRANRPDYPTLSGLNVRYKLSKTEAGHQMKFSKFGCGYEITFACPGECNEADKAKSIAQEMGVINAR